MSSEWIILTKLRGASYSIIECIIIYIIYRIIIYDEKEKRVQTNKTSTHFDARSRGSCSYFA